MTADPARTDVAVWFEIPAADFDRATGFYEALFDASLKREDVGPYRLAVFPYDRPSISGAVIAGPKLTPAADGSIVYLNVDGRLDETLSRVPALGGSVALPRTELPRDLGAFAHIIDTEGNRVGLHTSA